MLPTGEILTRLLLASFFGALIGLERERKDWAAGLRTHMMVSVGSCLIMIVSAFGFSDVLGTENIGLDPSRVAAQVVSGIGFIGAGTILFLRQGVVRGLTTASGLWTVAAIGLATGGGLYFAAAITTVIALIILWALPPFVKLFTSRFKHASLRIVAYQKIDNIRLFNDMIEKEGLRLQSFTFEKEDSLIIFDVKFENLDKSRMNMLIEDLKADPAVKSVSWIHD